MPEGDHGSLMSAPAVAMMPRVPGLCCSWHEDQGLSLGADDREPREQQPVLYQRENPVA